MREKFCVLLLAFFATARAAFIPRWHVLEQDQELNVELEPHKEIWYLIKIAASHSMAMYVTPCGSQVHWSIYSLEDGLAALPASGSLSEFPNAKLVAGEADDVRMKFYSKYIDSEYAMLVLSAPAAGSARIFVSSEQSTLENYYPLLPKDTRLAHALSPAEWGVNKALITWKMPEYLSSSENGRYRFCAIVSRKYPDWAICGHLDEALESIHCVPQHNNSMIINKLKSGKRYYISVFLRDSLKGTTSSYETLEVEPSWSNDHASAEQKLSQTRPLVDGALQAGTLPSRRGAVINYRFELSANATGTQRVLLIAHACDGYVRMNVYRNEKLLKRSEPFTGFRRFLVINVKSGQLRFQITNDDNHSKHIRMWASTKTDKSPYPLLPEDTSVKMVRRTCSTATLQWLRSGDKHAEYCIYKRRENAHFLEQLVSRVDNLCEGGLDSSELVGCYSHRGPRNNRVLDDTVGVIETTITGLSPSSTYRFDLLATPLNRASAQSLPYRTVWVRTSNQC